MSSFAAFRAATMSLRICQTRVKPLAAAACIRHPTRSFQTSTACWKNNESGKDEPLTEFVYNVKKKDKKNIGKITDERIPYRVVQLADPVTGVLSEPRTLSSILDEMEKTVVIVENRKGIKEEKKQKKTHYLLLVADKPSPIVKLIDRRAEYREMKKQKEQSKEKAKNTMEKEVHITWGANPSDTEHKLQRAREFLEKGYRLNILFMYKKGQPIPSKQGMEERVQKVVDDFSDIGTEYKPRDHKFSMAGVFLKLKDSVAAVKQLEAQAARKWPRSPKETTPPAQS